MCRIMQTHCNEKERLQRIRLKIGNFDPPVNNSVVERPVLKVVLLLESEKGS